LDQRQAAAAHCLREEVLSPTEHLENGAEDGPLRIDQPGPAQRHEQALTIDRGGLIL
jgi:hypothetical protein